MTSDSEESYERAQLLISTIKIKKLEEKNNELLKKIEGAQTGYNATSNFESFIDLLIEMSFKREATAAQEREERVFVICNFFRTIKNINESAKVVHANIRPEISYELSPRNKINEQGNSGDENKGVCSYDIENRGFKTLDYYKVENSNDPIYECINRWEHGWNI